MRPLKKIVVLLRPHNHTNLGMTSPEYQTAHYFAAHILNTQISRIIGDVYYGHWAEHETNT